MNDISTELATYRSREFIRIAEQDRLAREVRAARAAQTARGAEAERSDDGAPNERPTGRGTGARPASDRSRSRVSRRWRARPLNAYQNWLAAGRL